MSMLILVDYPEGRSLADPNSGITYTLIKDLGPFRLSYQPYNFDTGEGRKARITKIEEDKVTIEMDVMSQVTPNKIAYIGEVASMEVPLFSYESDSFEASRDKILSVAPNLHGPLPEGYISENRLFLITLEDFLSYDYRQKSLEKEVDCLLYSLVKEPKIEKKIREKFLLRLKSHCNHDHITSFVSLLKEGHYGDNYEEILLEFCLKEEVSLEKALENKDLIEILKALLTKSEENPSSCPYSRYPINVLRLAKALLEDKEAKKTLEDLAFYTPSPRYNGSRDSFFQYLFLELYLKGYYPDTKVAQIKEVAGIMLAIDSKQYESLFIEEDDSWYDYDEHELVEQTKMVYVQGKAIEFYDKALSMGDPYIHKIEQTFLN
ncbi:MAG: hypothetical protein II467_06285 [Bacilli bacterium]|nr:hypothetical protein [Bacilli bacterium]